MSTTQLNLVSTSAVDGGGTEGLIQTPLLEPTNLPTGYNYGFADGFMEFGAGTAGSLPFKVDEHGDVTCVALTASGVVAETAGTDTSGTATASTPSFSTGSAAQVSTTQDAMLYIAVNTSASLAIAIGPTSSAATPIVAAESVALGVITLRVPKGWYVKITGTIADLTITAITC